MKRIQWVLCGCAALALAVQFVKPSIPAPTERMEISAPPEAVRVLKTSCYGCHSNERRLAWFDEVVPAYWLVRQHVLDGRRHLNLSTLGNETLAEQRAALFEAVNMASLGQMPLKSFLALHPGARVDAADLNALKFYLAPWRDVPASASDPSALTAPVAVEASPAGLDFDTGYHSWHLLSVTDRGDNNTFRFILGNDIALKAAREGKISPWPDGARLAKIAWKQRTSPSAVIEPGEFVQIEMMVKDPYRHRSVDGWQWGRWKGAGLAPFGKDATFVQECTGCHAPMRRHDAVFTMPIASAPASEPDLLNMRAAALPVLPFDPFAAVPITLCVNREQSTISVLVRRATDSDRLLLTWKEWDDPHWFGARIPGDFLFAEFVRDPVSSAIPEYTKFNRDGSVDRTASPEAVRIRTKFIAELKAAPYMVH